MESTCASLVTSLTLRGWQPSSRESECSIWHRCLLTTSPITFTAVLQSFAQYCTVCHNESITSLVPPNILTVCSTELSHSSTTHAAISEPALGRAFAQLLSQAQALTRRDVPSPEDAEAALQLLCDLPPSKLSGYVKTYSRCSLDLKSALSEVEAPVSLASSGKGCAQDVRALLEEAARLVSRAADRTHEPELLSRVRVAQQALHAVLPYLGR